MGNIIKRSGDKLILLCLPEQEVRREHGMEQSLLMIIQINLLIKIDYICKQKGL